MTAPSHIHPSKWCTEVPPDKQRFPLCSRSWCESYTKQFSVSWLSSLTETKQLSFFLTPPNSLKCHRNTFSWCRAEQQCQTWRCSFPFGVPLFKTHSLALLLQIRVKFTCTRSWVSFAWPIFIVALLQLTENEPIRANLTNLLYCSYKILILTRPLFFRRQWGEKSRGDHQTQEVFIRLPCKWTCLQNISFVSWKDCPILTKLCSLIGCMCFVGSTCWGKKTSPHLLLAVKWPHNQTMFLFLSVPTQSKITAPLALLCFHEEAKHSHRVRIQSCIHCDWPAWRWKPWYAAENQFTPLLCAHCLGWTVRRILEQLLVDWTLN